MNTDAVVLALITGLGIPAVMWIFKDGWAQRISRLERLADLKAKATTSDLLSIIDLEIKFEKERRKGWKWLPAFSAYSLGGVGVGLAVTAMANALIQNISTNQALLAGGGVALFGIALALRDVTRRGPRT